MYEHDKIAGIPLPQLGTPPPDVSPQPGASPSSSKFCIDCRRYRADAVVSGLPMHRPGAQHVVAVCLSPIEPDPVSGAQRFHAVDCNIARASDELCGSGAAWFEPATLDGRLAMLADRD